MRTLHPDKKAVIFLPQFNVERRAAFAIAAGYSFCLFARVVINPLLHYSPSGIAREIFSG